MAGFYSARQFHSSSLLFYFFSGSKIEGLNNNSFRFSSRKAIPLNELGYWSFYSIDHDKPWGKNTWCDAEVV